MSVTIIDAPLTNSAYGFPKRGLPRRRTPELLICIHITSNPNTLTDPMAERQYANRPASPGPSAHDYIGQDGTVVAAIDPALYAAWSNGDVQTPNTALPLVGTVLAWRAAGFNANEAYYREVECCGTGSAPITAAQKEAVAQLIAADSRATGIPISRATVGTHADVNTVTRSSCAFPPAVREAELAGIIARARALAGGGTDDVDPVTQLPLGRVDIAAGATIYSDLASTAVLEPKAAFTSYVGAKGVGAYCVAKRPGDGHEMVQVRLNLGGGGQPDNLVTGWVGRDKAPDSPVSVPTATLTQAFNDGVSAAVVAASAAKK